MFEPDGSWNSLMSQLTGQIHDLLKAKQALSQSLGDGWKKGNMSLTEKGAIENVHKNWMA